MKKQQAPSPSRLKLLFAVEIGIVLTIAAYLLYPPLAKWTTETYWRMRYWLSEMQQKSQEKLVFVPLDTKARIATYVAHVPPSLTLPYAFEAIECIDKEQAGSLFTSKPLRQFIPEPYAKAALDTIANRRYNDEYTYTRTDGTTSTTNQGVRSQKDILYESICRSKSTYYIVFTTMHKREATLIPRVWAGGGMYWGPQNLAVISPAETSITERMDTPARSAYWGCTNILGLSGNTLYIGCGGGDGCCSAANISTMDLITKHITELAYCEHFPNEHGLGYEEKCTDATGHVYYDKVDPQTPQ